MDCKKVDKLLIRYLEGNLAESRHSGSEEGLKSLLEKHLQNCKQCQKEFSLLRQILETSKSEKVSSPSEDYWAGYVARLWQKIDRSMLCLLPPHLSSKEEAGASKRKKAPATDRTAFRKRWAEYIFRWAAPVFVSLFLFIVYFYPLLKTKKSVISYETKTPISVVQTKPARKTEDFTPKAGISRQSTLIKLALPLPLPESLLLAEGLISPPLLAFARKQGGLLLANEIYEFYNPVIYTTEVLDEVYAQVVNIEILLREDEEKDYLTLIDDLTSEEKIKLIEKMKNLL